MIVTINVLATQGKVSKAFRRIRPQFKSILDEFKELELGAYNELRFSFRDKSFGEEVVKETEKDLFLYAIPFSEDEFSFYTSDDCILYEFVIVNVLEHLPLVFKGNNKITSEKYLEFIDIAHRVLK